MQFSVVPHAIDALRAKFPELSTGDAATDRNVILSLLENSVEFGSQTGNGKLFLSPHESKAVLATNLCKHSFHHRVIQTVLTYDEAMANSQVRDTQRKNSRNAKYDRRNRRN